MHVLKEVQYLYVCPQTHMNIGISICMCTMTLCPCISGWECTLMCVFGRVVFSFSRLGRGYALAHACYARAEVPIALAESGT